MDRSHRNHPASVTGIHFMCLPHRNSTGQRTGQWCILSPEGRNVAIFTDEVEAFRVRDAINLDPRVQLGWVVGEPALINA